MPYLRIKPDDDVRRVRNVWIGPKGMTLPFQATYTAWVLFIVIFLGEIAFEAVMPGMQPSIVPVIEISIAAIAATLISGALDHDKPLRALPRVFKQHGASALAVLRNRRATTTTKPTLRVRVRTRETDR